MKHVVFDYPFGPMIAEGNADAMSFVSDHREALYHGFTAPVPLALFRPRQLFINGEPVDPHEITQQFKYRHRGDFPALFVRGYDEFPARIADNLPWTLYQSPKHIDKREEDLLQTGRRFWQDYYESLPQNARPSRSTIFNNLARNLILQTKHMIRIGLSPISGKEPDHINNIHLHLQNYSLLSASLIEWNPISRISQLETPYYHYVEIISSAYDAYINLGALILPRSLWKTVLLSSHQFAAKVLYGLRPLHPDLPEVSNYFLPVGAKESDGFEKIYRHQINGDSLFAYLTGHDPDTL